MMKMEFEIAYKDGRKVKSVAGPKEIVAFERQFSRAIPTDKNDMRLEYLFYLAWSGLHNAGIEPDGFDDFLSKVEDVDGDGEEAQPFPQEASPSPSQS